MSWDFLPQVIVVSKKPNLLWLSVSFVSANNRFLRNDIVHSKPSSPFLVWVEYASALQGKSFNGHKKANAFQQAFHFLFVNNLALHAGARSGNFLKGPIISTNVGFGQCILTTWLTWQFWQRLGQSFDFVGSRCPPQRLSWRERQFRTKKSFGVWHPLLQTANTLPPHPQMSRPLGRVTSRALSGKTWSVCWRICRQLEQPGLMCWESSRDFQQKNTSTVPFNYSYKRPQKTGFQWNWVARYLAQKYRETVQKR